ncbi:hypothetical protein N431DRAFT_422080 [Stipitochalara longipes BDJ]|nr:hypothetical protein N431DRAFT_422080 [Stipitochalara longipes BDJ]
MVGGRHMQIFVDPPPRGVFTYEDTVTGKVVFESKHEEDIGFVYVYFHGWVNSKVLRATSTTYKTPPSDGRYIDKEILFQKEKKVYTGHHKLTKDVQHIWPFQFDFRLDVNRPQDLPSTGKFFNSCSVEYKVIAWSGHIGQDETIPKRIMDPDDQMFMKDLPFNTGQVMTWAGKHLGVGADQELQFVKIRPSESVDQTLVGPSNVNLEIPSKHLPNIKYNDGPHHHGFHQSHSMVPFSVHVDIPRILIEGMPVSLFLSVTSDNENWTANPPLVQLTSFKMILHMVTIARASTYHEYNFIDEAVCEGKHLGIILSPQPIDVGPLLNLTLNAKGIVPTFDSRLLDRQYNLPTEIMIEVGGKSFKVKLIEWDNINIISRLAAISQPATNMPTNMPHHEKNRKKERSLPEFLEAPRLATRGAKKIRLQHSYVGRLIQAGNGPLQPEAIMETALALSRVLTASSIQHVFLGGSAIKLLPYHPTGHLNDKNYDQRQNDAGILRPFFHEHFSVIEEGWTSDVMGLHVQFIDNIRGWKVNIEFPSITPQSNDWQKQWMKKTRNFTDEVNIDPVSLFNYRISCAINRELTEVELEDFQSLYEAFQNQLRHHSKQIDVNSASIAAGRYPIIQQILGVLDVDLGVVDPWTRPGAMPAIGERVPEPPYARNETFRDTNFRDEKVVPDEMKASWQARSEPIGGYGKYEEMYPDDNSTREASDRGYNEFGGGPSQAALPGAEEPEKHLEGELVRGFRRLLHRHHDK